MPRPDLYQDNLSPDFTLGELRLLLEYVRARQANPKMTLSQFAAQQGLRKTQLAGEIGKVEADAETLFFTRVLVNPLTRMEQGEYHFPEDLDAGVAALRRAYPGRVDALRNGSRKRKSQVTLDGEIWAEFAENVLRLYELTRQATAKRDTEPRARPAQVFGSTTPASIGHQKPRNDEFDRKQYLAWLQHQTSLLRAIENIPVFDLVRLTPGYEPEEPPPNCGPEETPIEALKPPSRLANVRQLEEEEIP